MILVDANLLVYAALSGYPQHARARAWLEGVINQPGRVGLPWPCLVAFLRLTTNPRLHRQPLDAGTAWSLVRAWLDLPDVWIPQPTERHADVLRGLLLATQATGNLVHDAHLAALALEHGLTVMSADSDFARFPGVRWQNPVA